MHPVFFHTAEKGKDGLTCERKVERKLHTRKTSEEATYLLRRNSYVAVARPTCTVGTLRGWACVRVTVHAWAIHDVVLGACIQDRSVEYIYRNYMYMYCMSISLKQSKAKQSKAKQSKGRSQAKQSRAKQSKAKPKPRSQHGRPESRLRTRVRSCQQQHQQARAADENSARRWSGGSL